MFNIQSLYQDNTRKIVTAHRGFSGNFPENTILAFEEAYKLGVDIIEFDVRATADGKAVIMHDETVDRTTNGNGRVSDLNLSYLKSLNASYWQGPHDTGKGLSSALYESMPIPTLAETLEYLHDKDVGINIQMYVQDNNTRDRVCELYQHHELYRKAYLMVGTFAEAEEIRKQYPKIEICVGEDRGNLKRHKAFGSTFIQPAKGLVTPDFCKQIQQMGLLANMFFSNTKEENKLYLNHGIQGIMTDRPDLLMQSISEFNSI